MKMLISESEAPACRIGQRNVYRFPTGELTRNAADDILWRRRGAAEKTFVNGGVIIEVDDVP